MTKVTYVPQEHGAPAEIVWNGVTFPANVAVELDPVKHSYMVPEVEKWVDPQTQRILSKAIEVRRSMVEIAKTNPTFLVEGEPVIRDRQPTRRGRPRIPKTSEEYRAHCIAWIETSEDHEDLAMRWEEEEEMRQRCQVGDDDVSYLRPMFDAKFHELKKQAE